MTIFKIIEKYKKGEIDEHDLFYRNDWPEWKALSILLTEFHLIYDDGNNHKKDKPYTVIDRDYKLSANDIMAKDWNIYKK